MDFPELLTRSDDQLQELNNRFAKYCLRAMGPGSHLDFDPELTGGWMVHATYLSMGRRHDYREFLANVMAPTLVLHGVGDQIPALGSQRYAESIPNTEIILVEGAGHAVFADQPQRFAELVGGFLARRPLPNVR